LAEYGYQVKSTDLMDRGFCESGIDFLKLLEFQKYDCIFTNPPFKLALEFVKKAL